MGFFGLKMAPVHFGEPLPERHNAGFMCLFVGVKDPADVSALRKMLLAEPDGDALHCEIVPEGPELAAHRRRFACSWKPYPVVVRVFAQVGCLYIWSPALYQRLVDGYRSCALLVGSCALTDKPVGRGIDVGTFDIESEWPDFWKREPVPAHLMLEQHIDATRVSFPCQVQWPHGWVWHMCSSIKPIFRMRWAPGGLLRSLFPYGMPWSLDKCDCHYCYVGHNLLVRCEPAADGVRSLKELCAAAMHARGIPDPRYYYAPADL